MKDALELKDVLLIGRTFKEYCAYFQLRDTDLKAGPVLDMGAGIGSFCAEAAEHGCDVTAADPIYGLNAHDIAAKSRTDLDELMRQLPEVTHKYNWNFYASHGDLRAHREEARRIFLGDYSRRSNKYVAAKLPNTAFATKAFSLVLVSHFLFLYEDRFDYDLHRSSIMELARIARREIRIYPLVNMRGTRSSYLEQLMNDPACSALSFERVPSDFEFFKNADELLIIRPA
jgi:SAM-dependent methyltransferase